MTMTSLPPSICLFLCFGQSLSSWKEAGIYDREISLYKQLAAAGVKVGIVTWGGEEELEFQNELKEIQIIPAGKHSVLRSFLSPWKLRKKIAPYQLIKTEQMYGAWVAILTAILCSKPLLLRCGYELYRFKLQENKPLHIRLLTWLLSFWAYHSAQQITLTNPDDAHFVCKTFGKSLGEKINIRSNFIDTDKFSSTNLPKKRRVLSVGRLVNQKNYTKLIEACALSNVSLTIIGSGPLQSKLSQLANKLNVDVQFHGAVPNEKLKSFYTTHALFALTSWHEGNPKSLLEAMSCACPIVGTNVAGIKELITHEKNGLLCNPSSSEDISNAIQRLLNDSAESKRLGAAAREYIHTHASLNKIMQLEIDQYRSMCYD